MKQSLTIPDGCTQVLLHACCAPCSSAIVEWLLQHGVRPTIFYFNPNIWPREEYEIRKQESQRHARSLGINWIDGDYDHLGWLSSVCGMEHEPERGRRCEQCFTIRLMATACMARETGIRHFATTLASSRWKSLEQINRAGLAAQQAWPGTLFWVQNWRKDGLQERRNQLLREFQFYNQQYCGCEFSAQGAASHSKPLLREQMRLAKRQHAEQLPQWSRELAARVYPKLADSKVVMAYWPLPDEVDLRPLIERLVAEGKTVLLPKVTGESTMEPRLFTSLDDLREGAFHILEPSGPLFTDLASIDTALVPGVAFDAAGHRLGRGRGYYDRFLASVPHIHTIGICFPFQRVPQVPFTPHDITIDEVIG